MGAVRRCVFRVRILNEPLWHSTCGTWFQYNITHESGKSRVVYWTEVVEKKYRFLKRLHDFLLTTANVTQHDEWIDPDRLESYERSQLGPPVTYRFFCDELATYAFWKRHKINDRLHIRHPSGQLLRPRNERSRLSAVDNRLRIVFRMIKRTVLFVVLFFRDFP